MRLSGAKTAVLTEYRGLTVQQLSELRKQLKTVAAEYRVIKNRLARVAIGGSGLEALRTHLTGPTAVVIGRADPVAVARTLAVFVRTHPALAIKVGLVEGQLLESPELRAMADLPSREVLRGQLVGSIQGPMANLVGVLTAPQRELVHVLAERGKGAAGD